MMIEEDGEGIREEDEKIKPHNTYEYLDYTSIW